MRQLLAIDAVAGQVQARRYLPRIVGRRCPRPHHAARPRFVIHHILIHSFISTIEMETTSHLLSTNTIDRSSQLPKLRDHDYSAAPHRTREDNKNTGRNNENKSDAGFKSSLFADFLFEERMTIVPDLVQRVMQEPTMSHHNDFLLFSRPQPVQGKKCQQTHSGNLIITPGYLIFEIFSTKGSSKDSTS